MLNIDLPFISEISQKKAFRIPYSSLLLRVCHKMAGYGNNKGVKISKMHFEAPQNPIKCDWIAISQTSLQLLNMGQKFHIC